MGSQGAAIAPVEPLAICEDSPTVHDGGTAFALLVGLVIDVDCLVSTRILIQV